MTEDIMKIYEKFFSSTEKKVRKFKRTYQYYFPDSYMGLDDLQQEIKITILEVIQKFAKTDPGGVMRICNQKIEWKLVDLLRNSALKQKHYVTQKIYIANDNEEEEEEFNISFDLFTQPKANFKLVELLAVLTDLEYEIINQILLDKKSLTEIANELRVSPQYIHKIYNNIKAKVKHYLQNKQGVSNASQSSSS